MTLPTRRLIITGLSAGAGLAAAGLASLSPAAAVKSSYDFSGVIFNERFSNGSDFSMSWRWSNRSEPEPCASYDWGVFAHDTHSISSSVGHVLQRKHATPLKGFQNRFDEEPALRYISQAFVTTQGLFSFVCDSLKARARFPRSAEGLFADIWLRADDDDNGGETDVVETYSDGDATGVAESAVHYGQTGGKRSNLGVSPRPDLTQWHTYGIGKTPKSILFLFDDQSCHEVLHSAPQKGLDAYLGNDATYRIYLTTHNESIHQGRLKHEGFTQAQVDTDYIVARAMDEQLMQCPLFSSGPGTGHAGCVPWA